MTAHSLGSLIHCLTALMGKKLFLIYSQNLSWFNLCLLFFILPPHSFRSFNFLWRKNMYVPSQVIRTQIFQIYEALSQVLFQLPIDFLSMLRFSSFTFELLYRLGLGYRRDSPKGWGEDSTDSSVTLAKVRLLEQAWSKFVKENFLACSPRTQNKEQSPRKQNKGWQL